jgi:GLPGLI family protein
MKRIPLLLIALFAVSISNAQMNAGRIIYERTTQLRMQLQGGNEAFAQMIPKTRTDRYELLFGDNKTIWHNLPADDDDGGDMNFNNGGGQVRFVMGGLDDIIFCNLGEARQVEQREIGQQKFIVEDSIRNMGWKMSEETKTISGYACRKATCQRMVKNSVMRIENGQPEKIEVTDTLNVTAWFTDAIPVATGPQYYQGQLPGAILEIDVNDGRTTFKVIEISNKADLATIKEPKGSKKLTPEGFKAEREKLMEEMRKNGGNMMMRRGN